VRGPRFPLARVSKLRELKAGFLNLAAELPLTFRMFTTREGGEILLDMFAGIRPTFRIRVRPTFRIRIRIRIKLFETVDFCYFHQQLCYFTVDVLLYCCVTADRVK
jgi:hypothetical protein